MATSITLPNAQLQQGCDCQRGLASTPPPRGVTDLPKNLTDWARSCCPLVGRDSHSAHRWQRERAFAPYHSRTAGNRRIPSPWSGNSEGLLKRKMSGISLSHPRSHSAPPSPYEESIEGVPFGTSTWSVSLQISPSPPFRDDTSRLARIQRPPCSHIKTRRYPNMRPMIRKLSRMEVNRYYT